MVKDLALRHERMKELAEFYNTYPERMKLIDELCKKFISLQFATTEKENKE